MPGPYAPSSDALELVCGNEVCSCVLVFQDSEIQAQFKQGLDAPGEERDGFGLRPRVACPYLPTRWWIRVLLSAHTRFPAVRELNACLVRDC